MLILHQVQGPQMCHRLTIDPIECPKRRQVRRVTRQLGLGAAVARGQMTPIRSQTFCGQAPHTTVTPEVAPTGRTKQKPEKN